MFSILQSVLSSLCPHSAGVSDTAAAGPLNNLLNSIITFICNTVIIIIETTIQTMLNLFLLYYLYVSLCSLSPTDWGRRLQTLCRRVLPVKREFLLSMVTKCLLMVGAVVSLPYNSVRSSSVKKVRVEIMCSGFQKSETNFPFTLRMNTSGNTEVQSIS